MASYYKTKTEKKRALLSIKQKAFKLTQVSLSVKGPVGLGQEMSLRDYEAISKICDKILKKL